MNLAEWLELVEVSNMYHAAYNEERETIRKDDASIPAGMSVEEARVRKLEVSKQMTGPHSRRIE